MKKNCSYDVSSCLLRFGADLNHQDATGRTPLHVFFNESARSILEFHQEDADSTTQDSRGMNIVQYVSWSKSSLPIDLFRSCRGNISSLEVTDEEGRTALHFACQRGNLELLECLVNEQNAAISRPDWHGRTLMHYATESGRSAETIVMLARRGFNLRAVDHKGRTVLHHAASGRSVAAVEKLIELGAGDDLTVLDDDARTPLQLAALCGRTKTVELLRLLCDDAQVSKPINDQKVMGGHGRGSNSNVGSPFNVPLSALFSISLVVACLFLRFVYE